MVTGHRIDSDKRTKVRRQKEMEREEESERRREEERDIIKLE